MTDDLRALSVKQPWGFAICELGKDLENRKARYGRRGLTLIHASAGITPGYYAEAIDFMTRHGLPEHQVPTLSALRRGGIIGVAEIVDAISASDPRSSSPWWMGPYALVLANARPLPFIPCKGTVAPMFWTPPPEVVEQVRRYL